MQRDLLADALDLVHSDLTRYVAFPSPEAADALTLWIAATHSQVLWEHATRFVLKSPVKRCGKTRAQEIVQELIHNPLVAGSISAAALVRTITESDPPTVVLDEADGIFSGKSADEAAEALRNVLNNGFSRGRPYLRWDVKRREIEKCPTFAMACIAGIGDLPDTIEDRAVVVTMQRRAPGETVDQYRQRDSAGLHSLRKTLEHAISLTLGMYDAYEPPSMPVEDRAADVWEPLVAVAEAAGRDWPDRARKACVTLTGEDEDDQTLGQKLLTDLQAVWADDEEHLATVTILERLHRLDESPWPDYFGRELNPRDLGRLLRPYQVKPKTVRPAVLPDPDKETYRGYSRADLYPVWTRYTFLPEKATQATQATQPHTNDTDSPPLTRDVTDVSDVLDFPGSAWVDPTQTATEATQDELPDPAP